MGYQYYSKEIQSNEKRIQFFKRQAWSLFGRRFKISFKNVVKNYFFK